MNLNPIPPVLEALAKLFAAVKGVKTANVAIIALLIVAVFGIYSINGHEPTPEVESVRFERNLRATHEVQSLLDENRQKVNGDRLVIRLLHNGQMGLSGIPFQYIKTAHASVRAGVSEPAELYMDYPSESVNNLLSDMFLNGGQCVTVKQANAKDGTIRKSMRDLGVAMTYTCPIYNSKHFPVGYISAGYIDADRKRPEDQAVFDILKQAAVEYADTMDTITEGEDDGWMTKARKALAKLISGD